MMRLVYLLKDVITTDVRCVRGEPVVVVGIEVPEDRRTVDSAKKDPFYPVLTLTRCLTMVFLHKISNRKYVYAIEN